jgi:hypothetical protein
MEESASGPPYDWVGRRVEALIVEGAIYDDAVEQDTVRPARLIAMHRAGTLEAVNALGIVASLAYAGRYEVEEHEPISTFYPWSAVLSLRLQD